MTQQAQFVASRDAVYARTLAWGNNNNNGATALSKLSRVDQMPLSSTTPPVLILASDCVYYKELHLPLEQTIFDLLSNTNTASEEDFACLIATLWRWKSNNTFYKQFRRCTRTKTPTLVGNVLEMRVSVNTNHGGRSVLQMFAVQLVSR